MFEYDVVANNGSAVIKVIGVGGGGGNAIEHMVSETIDGVEFICANTDLQALNNSSASTVIQVGKDITKGLGAGANPEVGRQAALEDREAIRSALSGADMVFIAAGMGGGTGTGAAPVVAEIAKEEGILTVAVVTKPFSFEGKKRSFYAEQGTEQLAQHVDSLITVHNDKLMKVLGGRTSLLDAFKAVNGVLLGAVQGIAELITSPGIINVDFADVRTVMSEMGNAMMGSGVASGDNRAEEATEAAIASPLLEDIDLSGARGVLVSVTASLGLTLEEFDFIGNHVNDYVNPSDSSDAVTVVIGTVLDESMGDDLRVTIIATGIGSQRKPDIQLVGAKTPEKAEAPSMVNSMPMQPAQTGYSQAAKTNADVMPGYGHTQNSNLGAPASTTHSAPAAAKPKAPISAENILDVPTFLRRQAD
ncbi:MAG: cell division protein FtsZ [Ferrimonas sp.]